MAKKKKNQEPAPEENYFIISLEKKKKILGVFLIVLALLIFLSILSYSGYDQANLTYGFTDLFKIFSSDPEFVSRAESTHNWLGIFGAYISDFFVNSTIGYFSIIFPVILFIWGFSISRRQNYKLSVYLSNFLIIIGLIISTLFGMLRYELDLFADINELSGNVGGFFGMAIGRLLGGLGSVIFLFALLFITLIVAFDIKISRIWNFFKELWSDGEGDADDEKIESDEKTDENISKIKELRKNKKPKKKFLPSLDDEEVEEQEAEEFQETKQTNIRIIKREDEEQVIEPELEPPFEESEKPGKGNKKQKGKDKDDEGKEKEKSAKDIIPAVDIEKEAELPNQWEEDIKYKLPKLDILNQPSEEEKMIPEEELKRNAELLKEKLSLFDIEIEDISVTPGPVVTLYEIVPSPGVKISRIVSLENDIALALAARGIRIIAPIPGKSAIGVEIPNAESSTVYARTVISKIKETKAELPLALGKTISGDVYITDLARMPHLLIAGSTGAGKSVGINMMITSLLYSKDPSDIKFVIIDPKKIELSFYTKLTKHYLAVSPDIDEEIITNPQNALLVLKAVEYEMEKRYDKLAKAGVRNIIDYNIKISDPKRKPKDTESMKHHKMPYIIVIIDELADLMMTSGKEVEEPIARLAQLARAVGIHLIVATQRPSVNIITGTIKANFSARIAYQTATRIDSRTILDMKGAEQLLGRGDMLFLPGGMPKPIRVQNALITTDEVEKLTDYIYVQKGYSKRYFLPSMFEKKGGGQSNFIAELDEMFDEAARVIVMHQQGSVSLLQRRLKLGYARAARIVDQLEEAGIVGPSEGSKAREVLVENEEQLEVILRSL
ncbi:MAG: DNA translocase FtsK [Melioribacteraceae bacterium]|nr:DNA translocase FtsK [Melioribacteraceae bacterium]MCF8355839.1 DNA translocase FtsK [Melioribacteraceae bacterium]MCF8392586.1 DNA translocase FtsK [Melioribacteraceae bacterium]MCF8418542.1 DNA translocase FtsK [Melioribacteraceae bacterium]